MDIGTFLRRGLTKFREGQNVREKRPELDVGFTATRKVEKLLLLRTHNLYRPEMEQWTGDMLDRTCEAFWLEGRFGVTPTAEPVDEMADMRRQLSEMKALLQQQAIPKAQRWTPPEAPTEEAPEEQIEAAPVPPHEMKWPALKKHAKASGINTRGMKQPQVLAALEARTA